jgi:pimeloyl-ACP methyl ester carboxylesterase
MGESVAQHVAGPVDGEAVAVGEVVLDTHLAPGRDGPLTGETLLLVAGLGRQRTHWPPALLAGLRASGLAVLAVDNRDAGGSTSIDAPTGDGAAYDLADMAADLVGVLDHHGLERVHVLGVSMGGMIAQHLAFTHHDRVASLISVMSTTGARDVGQATPEAARVLTTPEPPDPAPYVEHYLDIAEVVGSPGLVDREAERVRFEVAAERGLDPDGTVRQLLAILADRNRTSRLAGVRAPTLVVHGTDDPLIQPSGGEATAAAIPGARLHLIDGMGHDLPAAHLPELVGAVVAHVTAAAIEGAAGAGWSHGQTVP